MTEYKPQHECQTVDDIIRCVQVRDSGTTFVSGQAPKTAWDGRDSMLVREILALREQQKEHDRAIEYEIHNHNALEERIDLIASEIPNIDREWSNRNDVAVACIDGVRDLLADRETLRERVAELNRRWHEASGGRDRFIVRRDELREAVVDLHSIAERFFSEWKGSQLVRADGRSYDHRPEWPAMRDAMLDADKIKSQALSGTPQAEQAGEDGTRQKIARMLRRRAGDIRDLNRPGVPDAFVQKHNTEASILEFASRVVLRSDLDWNAQAMDEMNDFVQRQYDAHPGDAGEGGD